MIHLSPIILALMSFLFSWEVLGGVGGVGYDTHVSTLENNLARSKSQDRPAMWPHHGKSPNSVVSNYVSVLAQVPEGR